MRRRKVLITAGTVATASLTGCLSLIRGNGGSATWKEAFQQETSEESKTRLSKTPIAVSDVDSEAEVQTSLAVLGWTLGVQDISEGLVNDLEAAVATASELRPELQSGVDLLNRGLDLVQKMKDRSALGTSVWDAAIKAAPQLELYVSTAKEVRSQLAAMSERLGEIESTSQSVLDHIDRIRTAGTTEFGSLPDTVAAAKQVYENIVSDLSDIQEGVQLIVDISDEARSVANEIPVMGEQVARIFGQMAATFRTIDELLARFESEVQTVTGGLGSVLSTAKSEANGRFATISKKATGSEQQMDVTAIETGVQAYGAGSTSTDGTGNSTTSGS